MSLIDIVILFCTGLVAGFFSGLVGIGGGIFYVLIYTFFLNKLGINNEQEFVRMLIANSIFSTLFAALGASWKQIKFKNFYLDKVLLIGIPGAIASIGLTYIIQQTGFYNKSMFSIVFTIALLPLIYRMLKTPSTAARDNNLVPKLSYSILGLFSGMATALSGLGGAFLITPVLNGWLRVKIKQVVSIAVGVIVIVALATSIYNMIAQGHFEQALPYSIGGVSLSLTLPLIAGVLLSAPFGVKVGQNIAPKQIKRIFAGFCIVVVIFNILSAIL